MQIRFTTPALLDLEELRIYLSEVSPQGLDNVIKDIEKTVYGILGSLAKGRRTPRDDVYAFQGEKADNRLFPLDDLRC